MENSLARKENRVPSYVEESMQTLDGALQYANMLLSSKLCPRHFYELTKDAKGRTVPDYTKGKPEAVLIVLQHGKEVGMSISQSLQQIIPVNGLISIKGDGAKSLIFSSGKLEKDTWKEKTTGSIATKDLRVSITAQRSDHGEILTRSFSVEAAMRAGLWVTDAKLKGQDAWKYKLSPWYRYPERMIKYRALGFLSRDLFPDVIMGMVTEEEAKDYPVDEGATTITKPDGAKLQLDHPDHKKERSEEITNNAVNKIDKNAANGGSAGGVNKGSDLVKGHTEKTLLNMGAKIYDLAGGMTYGSKTVSECVDMLPGKKSNKKYRDAILAYQEDKFFDYLKDHQEEGQVIDVEETQAQVETREDQPPKGPPLNGSDDIQDDQQEPEEAQEEEKDKEEENFDDQFGKGEGRELKEVKEEGPKEERTTNKQGIEIPELEETGSRPFEGIKLVYDALNDVDVDNERFDNITKGHKFGELFTNKEDFCRRGTVNEINELLNSL